MDTVPSWNEITLDRVMCYYNQSIESAIYSFISHRDKNIPVDIHICICIFALTDTKRNQGNVYKEL